MNGCEQEGLYRIPGSGREVKQWQMRFDQGTFLLAPRRWQRLLTDSEHDIDLFSDPDLYDINTITSLFKAWLRDLPDEIFPKPTQLRIAEQCAGAQTAPQMLKDELSKLPPYNYYLLFAITCHISLLHSCAEQNKMTYQNLCICFQPCLKMDSFIFYFLVCDWRNCWQGCWTEKEYMEEENRWLASQQAAAGDIPLPSSQAHSPVPRRENLAPPPPTPQFLNSDNMSVTPPSPQQQMASLASVDERAVSSSDSTNPSLTGSATPERPRPGPGHRAELEVKVHGEEEKETSGGKHGENLSGHELPPLSPFKPLSPIRPFN